MATNSDNKDTERARGWSYIRDEATPEFQARYLRRATAMFPESEKEVPRPHRCNGHLEDIVIAINRDPLNIWAPMKVFWNCLRSHVGQEPPRLNLSRSPDNRQASSQAESTLS